MSELWQVAWKRFGVITSIISDVNASVIAIVFYFTIFLPFGAAYTLLSDPLRRKSPGQTSWLDREAVPTDLDSAKQQG